MGLSLGTPETLSRLSGVSLGALGGGSKPDVSGNPLKNHVSRGGVGAGFNVNVSPKEGLFHPLPRLLVNRNSS